MFRILGRSFWFCVIFGIIAPAVADSNQPKDAGRNKLELLVVGIPLSMLHNPAAVAQEMCLRGHNVTVASLGEEGEKKTRKYTNRCPVTYISLAPSPLSKKDIEKFYVEQMSVTNNTIVQFSRAQRHLSPFFGIMEEPLEKLLSDGVINPDYALISAPLGGIPAVLDRHGVDFAIKYECLPICYTTVHLSVDLLSYVCSATIGVISSLHPLYSLKANTAVVALCCSIPTNLMQPLSNDAALWVPHVLRPVSIHSTSIVDRAITMGLNSLFYFGKRVAASLNVIPGALSDLNPATMQGRLVLVNAVVGIDYPQPLPPLVQYTGPVIETEKMEPFPQNVEAWLDAVPVGKPVVYISYGTITVLSDDFVRHVFSTMTGDDVYVLWALPKSQQSAVPDPLPPNFMVYHWIPTPRALSHPKVKAFVSHCGGNSVAESMALGKPIIGYPQFAEQTANCFRVADAGAGTTSTPRAWVTKDSIMEVLQEPKYAEKAQAVSMLFKTFGGVSKAADLLEAGSAGGLRLLANPREGSFMSWYKLGGYDLLAIAFIGAQITLFALYRTLSRYLRVNRRKVKTI